LIAASMIWTWRSRRLDSSLSSRKQEKRNKKHKHFKKSLFMEELNLKYD
jgi:hypothetical protein